MQVHLGLSFRAGYMWKLLLEDKLRQGIASNGRDGLSSFVPPGQTWAQQVVSSTRSQGPCTSTDSEGNRQIDVILDSSSLQATRTDSTPLVPVLSYNQILCAELVLCSVLYHTSGKTRDDGVDQWTGDLGSGGDTVEKKVCWERPCSQFPHPSQDHKSARLYPGTRCSVCVLES
jgi:hypothetical protein